MLPLTNIPQYYNLFDPSKQYKQFLFLAARGVQSAEFNELQANLHENNRAIFDSMFKNGTVLTGGALSASGTEISVDAGRVYANGYSLNISRHNMTIPPLGEVVIGFLAEFQIITDLMDPDLKDPAVATSNYQQGGAYRVQMSARWALATDPRPDYAEFYPVYTLVDGVLRGSEQIATTSQVNLDLLAKYDKAAHGSYVSEGFQITYQAYDEETNVYTLNLNGGIANVDGYQISTQFSRPILIEGVTEFATSVAEPISFVVGTTRYPTRFENIKRIVRIVVVKEKTVTVTHGAFNGANDLLPDSPVVALLEVKQGGTTYSSPSDFVQQGDFVSWAPPGLEPAPGSTYTVKYRYQEVITNILPNSDRKSFDISGVANATVMSVDYEYFMSRVDRIMLKKDGELTVLKGAPSYYAPVAPPPPGLDMSLATVRFSYGSDPVINWDFFKVFKMSDMAVMQNQLDQVVYNVGRLALMDSIRSTEPTTTKLNLFVDPLLDDSLRDLGTLQNLMVFNEQIQLNIATTVLSYGVNGAIPVMLPNTPTPTLSQTKWTKSRKINEFMNVISGFAKMSVSPSTLTFIAQSNTVISPTPGAPWWPWGVRWNQTSSVRVSNTNEIHPLPQTQLTINASPFNPNEAVDVFFENIKIATVNANGAGNVVNALVTTPVGALSGSRKLRVVGKVTGFDAEATFTSTPQVKTTLISGWWSLLPRRKDPVAQTFVLPETQFVHSVNLIFTVRPTSSFTISVSDTSVGMPVRNTVRGLNVFQPSDIAQLNVWQTFPLSQPVRCDAGVEYALVIEAADAIGELAVAKIGERDKNGGNVFVISQPYPDGVLLNSSNASSWSPIQDEDLTFVLNRANFQTSYKGSFGVLNVANATDFLLSAGIEVLPDTFLGFNLKLLDRAEEVIQIFPGEPVRLARYTGRVQLEFDMRTSNGKVTPQIEPNVQLMVGSVDMSGDYVSRTFQCGGTKISVYVEEMRQTGTTVQIFALDAGDVWIPLVRNNAKAVPMTGDFVEVPYEGTFSGAISSTRIKITLGTTNELIRPIVGPIRTYIAP